MKNLLLQKFVMRLIALFVFTFSALVVKADDPELPPTPPPAQNAVPIDGGLSVLAGLGALAAYKGLKKGSARKAS